MGYNFPASPSVGQAFNNYVWDGEKWQIQGSVTQGAVRYDIAQGLSSAQQVQGRSNLYATPFDAMAYSGMQINGSMEVSQERGIASPITLSGTATYFCDGWTAYKTGTMVGLAQIVTSGVSALFPGFLSCLVLSTSTAQASIGAGDFQTATHIIEGYRIVRLAWGTAGAQPLTISFWSAHGKIGTYTGSVRNAAGNRSCAFSYTQNVAGVAEFKTATIPGCTDGVWNGDNAVGMYIAFSMAAGSTYLAPSTGTWYSSFYIGASGQVNGVDSTSNVFRLTGVVVLPGIEAPSAARSPFIMRPYDQELLTCQRYYHRAAVSLVEYGVGGTAAGRWFEHPIHMRAVPTMTSTSGTFTNSTGPVIDNATNVGYRFRITVNVTGIGYVDGQVISADARL